MQMKSKLIKLISGLFLAGILASCGSVSPAEARKIRLTFIDCDNISPAFKTVEADRGEDVEVHLYPKEGYTLAYCSYENYSFDEETHILSLHNVNYPEQIQIVAKENDIQITFDINGGNFLDGRKDTTYTEPRLKGMHLRYNTSLGKDIAKGGCLLKGWNTKADGTGEEIGIGSRVTIEDGEEKVLYAEWVPYESPDNFDYALKDDKIILQKYNGNASSLILPDVINGYPVSTLAAGFAYGLQLEEVMLPKSIEKVEDKAFAYCTIGKISFFDNLADIGDGSFSNTTFDSWHISSADYPRLTGTIAHSQFEEDLDRLILNQDKKKLMFFAGCSMSYGLKSAMVQKEFPDYFVQNLGVIGGTNALFQMQIISHFVQEGDVLVHAPEVGSAYQLMAFVNAEYRMFTCVEGNYDLFNYVDASCIPGLFNAWREYQTFRSTSDPVTFDSHIYTYNSYGDSVVTRPFIGEDKGFEDGSYGYELSYLTAESVKRLKNAYAMFQEKGVTVLFSFSPTNYDGLSEEQLNCQSYYLFESFYKRYLPEAGVKVISSVRDYLYEGRYFFDKDYHLNDEGAILRTNHLITDLQRTGI